MDLCAAQLLNTPDIFAFAARENMPEKRAELCFRKKGGLLLTSVEVCRGNQCAAFSGPFAVFRIFSKTAFGGNDGKMKERGLDNPEAGRYNKTRCIGMI